MKTAIALGAAALVVAALAAVQAVTGRVPGPGRRAWVRRADRRALFWAVVLVEVAFAAAAGSLALRRAGVGPFAQRAPAGFTVALGGDAATPRWVAVRNDGPAALVVTSVRVNGEADCAIGYRPDGATMMVADGATFPQAAEAGETAFFVYHQPGGDKTSTRDVTAVEVVTSRGTYRWRPGRGIE